MHRTAYVSTSEVLRRLNDPSVVVVDVRPIEGYNGWRLQDERRGGHIRGAKSIPAKWTLYLDWPDIVRSRNIVPQQQIILYGYSREEMEMVAAHFNRTGYGSLFLYNHFASEWSPHKRLPMQKMRRYSHLVSAPWLKGFLRYGTAPECTNSRFVLCHAYYQNKHVYDAGHIPGAIPLDTNLLESPEDWNCRSPEELTSALKSLGISADTTVILYGTCSSPGATEQFPGSSAGHMGAMRCAFIMLYAGVKDVRILNGGMQSWIDEGYQTDAEEVKTQAVSDFNSPLPVHPEFVIDTDQAKEILRTPGKNLVCVRSLREYTGEESGYRYIRKKGRIPGAVFANSGSDAYHMENYRNVDGTTREYHEIEKMWAHAGITAETYNAFYCGTGWRASEAFMNAWLMGWHKIAVFDGGWLAWSSDESNPCETG